MKYKYYSRVFTFIIFGLVITIASNCKKDDPIQTVKDIDHNVYKTVKIGNQEWMSENLRVKRFKNGDSIKTTSTPTQDIFFIENPTYQWSYEGNEDNANKYGRLYSYFAIVDTCGICPEGWHIPSDQEWTILTDYLGGENIAQQLLREKNFNPQYGGFRLVDQFIDLNLYGQYGSNTTVEDTVPGAIDQVYIRTMAAGSKIVFRSYRYKKSGVSVRCIRDE